MRTIDLRLGFRNVIITSVALAASAALGCGSSADDAVDPETSGGSVETQGGAGQDTATGGTGGNSSSAGAGGGGISSSGGAGGGNSSGGAAGGGNSGGGVGGSGGHGGTTSAGGGGGSTGAGGTNQGNGGTMCGGTGIPKGSGGPSGGTLDKWENVTPAGISLNGSDFSGDNFGAQDVLVDPARPSDFYAFFCHQGVYKSTDYGQTWTKVNTGTNGAKIDSGKPWGEGIDSNRCRDPQHPPNALQRRLAGSVLEVDRRRGELEGVRLAPRRQGS